MKIRTGSMGCDHLCSGFWVGVRVGRKASKKKKKLGVFKVFKHTFLSSFSFCDAN